MIRQKAEQLRSTLKHIHADMRTMEPSEKQKSTQMLRFFRNILFNFYFYRFHFDDQLKNMNAKRYNVASERASEHRADTNRCNVCVAYVAQVIRSFVPSFSD